MRVTVNLGPKFGHYLQLRIVRANLDVEVLHIVWGALPPVLGVVGHVVIVADNGGLSILRSSGAIKVEAVEPNTRSVQHFPGMVFAQRFRGVRQMEV